VTNDVWELSLWVPVGLALAVVSLAASIFLAWWFARGPGLSVQASGTTLISSPGNERITVQYDGQVVERVTQSVIWLWRTGRGNIEGSAIVDEDPLTLTVPGGNRILDVTLLRQSRETNGFTHNFEKSASEVESVKLSFKYLDRGQGVALEVYHTAPDPESVEMSGTVMGIPRGIRRTSSGSTMRLPVGLVGSVAVTIPTGVIPWHLRGAGEQPRPLRDVFRDTAADTLRSMLRFLR
jgi:hypothetical protein